MKRPRWTFPPGARVKTMEEIENMQRLDARDGPQSPGAPIPHDAAHDALVQLNSYPDSTARMSAARQLQWYIAQQRERDSKLERAMAVVTRCLKDCEIEGLCWFCDWSPTNGNPFHDSDCPLVVNGFICADGSRKE